LLISEYLVEQNIYDIIAKSAVLNWLCEGHLWWNGKRREARTAKSVFIEAFASIFSASFIFASFPQYKRCKQFFVYCSHLFVFLAGIILVRNRPTIHQIRTPIPHQVQTKEFANLDVFFLYLLSSQCCFWNVDGLGLCTRPVASRSTKN
jgi:ABC-type polysaccharide/polyol phosphate export permease